MNYHDVLRRRPWRLQVDGVTRCNRAHRPGLGGVAFVLLDNDGEPAVVAGDRVVGVTANVAIYRAILMGLEYLRPIRPVALEVTSTNGLIVSQLRGERAVGRSEIAALHAEAMAGFRSLSLTPEQGVVGVAAGWGPRPGEPDVVNLWFLRVPEEENGGAGKLADLAVRRGKYCHVGDIRTTDPVIRSRSLAALRSLSAVS